MGALTKKNNVLLFLAAALVSLLIGIYIGAKKFPETRYVKGDTIVDTLLATDTVVKYVKVPEVKIRTVAKIKYLTDTVIITKPFVASVDTIIKRDTIAVKYFYPANLFTINLKERPQNEKIVYRYITLTKQDEMEDAWWVKPAWAGGGLFLGYIFGRLK